MKHIAAYLLCVLGGNASPSAGDVSKVLASVGAEADNDKLTKLMEQLSGKDVNEVIAAGSEKLASVPAGGAVAAGGASAAGGAAAEEKKEESEEEESDDDMGFSLFD
ncbi:ribosomal protein L12 [Chloropicon primus]|uniref:Ribosomal protein L12 n=1 Tax=Chloropicon primus TaxID=1764295 RepID=A0A5B8MFR0_9CHLO|nr:ribosomal protein L12 [Chloropicon primus]UPQ98349.1 ribosomal protein L12 [Chloropicon primus]|mmetsp:Transcript_2088/g.5681  ORF Transcript_2088/g.5681 Transcript_2088/m.5681 type:complete len:107 (-) Transcript_2088:54-374(-)|eukprot:QDZ19141.1 ribosomal protein L12 [Chloropicon primus]